MSIELTCLRKQRVSKQSLVRSVLAAGTGHRKYMREKGRHKPQMNVSAKGMKKRKQKQKKGSSNMERVRS